MNEQPVEHLDPNSPRGRLVTEQLTALFVNVRRRLAREQASQQPAA